MVKLSLRSGNQEITFMFIAQKDKSVLEVKTTSRTETARYNQHDNTKIVKRNGTKHKSKTVLFV